MPELHSNGNYDAYLAQLFNPAGAGQFNPGTFGPGMGGFGGVGAGGLNPAGTQSPWAAQNLSQANGLWPQQQAPSPAQSLAAIQIAQQTAARHAIHAVQCAQALQQIAQHLATQQQASGWQPQFGQSQPGQFGQGQSGLGQLGLGQFGPGQFGQGVGGPFGAGQIGQMTPQFNGSTGQNPFNQALQQQALLQLAQYLANQQQGQFRYGMAA